MDPALPVPAQDDRLLTHARDEVVARLRDLGFVPHEEPGSREDLLLLLGVDVRIDEDLAADFPALEIDNAAKGSARRTRHRHTLPIAAQDSPRRIRN